MEQSKRQDLNRLMAELADGKRSAFHPLFQSALPVVQRFSARLLNDPVEADDAAQAAMIKVFERAASFRAGAEAMTWILTIAAWECRTIRQKTRRRRIDSNSDTHLTEATDKASSPEKIALDDDLKSRVRDLLGELNETDQQTILSIIDGNERPDIAGATYRKRLQRALGRFKKAWEVKHGDF